MGGKERDQRSCGLSLTVAGNDAGCELGIVLNRWWQRASEFDGWLSQDFADLIETDLNVAAGHACVQRFKRRWRGLGFHLCSDAQLFEQAGHVDATGAPTGRIRISNRFCGQHRALEGVNRTDVRLRGTLAHKGTHTDLPDDDAIPGHDFALRLKSVDHWHRAYYDVGSLALFNTVRDSTRGSVGDHYFVSRGFFKIRYQCVNYRMQSRGR